MSLYLQSLYITVSHVYPCQYSKFQYSATEKSQRNLSYLRGLALFKAGQICSCLGKLSLTLKMRFGGFGMRLAQG